MLNKDLIKIALKLAQGRIVKKERFLGYEEYLISQLESMKDNCEIVIKQLKERT